MLPERCIDGYLRHCRSCPPIAIPVFMRQLNICSVKLCHHISDFPNTRPTKRNFFIFAVGKLCCCILFFVFLLTPLPVSGRSTIFRSPWYIYGVNLFSISFTLLSSYSFDSESFVVLSRSYSCFRFALIFIFSLFINDL